PPEPEYTFNDPAAQSMDLSSLGIAELSAIINGEGVQFSQQIADQDLQNLIGQSGPLGVPSPATQAVQAAETAKMIADLTGVQQFGPADDNPPLAIAPVSQFNMGSQLQSSLGPQQPFDAQPFDLPPQSQPIVTIERPPEASSFDFNFPNDASGGDVDFSSIDMSELVGLFGTDGSTDVTTQQPIQPQTAQPSRPPSIPQDSVAPLGDSGLGDLSGYDMAMGAIDMEDFNFNDGEMPQLGGDEFESLLAEFK
ncbi:hypothetical protein P7C73_g2589, partial [Tremellales sp. Uapishka_1]